MTMSQNIVGVLHLASKYKYGLTSRGAPMYLFRPYDEALPDYIVGCSERDTGRNQIALVSVTTTVVPASTLEKPRGALVNLYGPVGDLKAEQRALLQHYCHKRPPSVAEFTEFVHPTDSQRMEISPATGWRTWHVDPPGCRDIDDAIAWNPTTQIMAVTIADVAALVTPGSDSDTAAAEIGSTFYNLEGQVQVPMLDPQISEGAGSLLPGARRRGITLLIHSQATHPDHGRFVLSWITVAESYTYESFNDSALKAELGIWMDSHDWIADMMIRYNSEVATMLKKHGLGTLRIQKKGETPWASIPELSHLGAEAAKYSAATPDTDGHASLGLEAYTHASSPLRRYADLLNQRAIHAILEGKSYEPLTTDKVTALNERARANKRWGRDLTFMCCVTPGKVHILDVIWMDDNHVYVPSWKRPIRLRHTPAAAQPVGTKDRIRIFCDPTKPNWKRRILTADANEQQQ